MTDEYISYIAYESQGARLERSNKRLFILNAILIIALIFTNAAWIYYEHQFVDEVSVDQSVSTGEGYAFVNGIGDFIYDSGNTESN